ncbi:MAG: GAF domain-containing protein [Anaerolineales bacterium]|nr:GAF domain-containing protein [Anaerolineales bacterium]
MSISQTPLNDKKNSFAETVKQTAQRLIAPHPSVQGLDYVRRVQLLNVITLTLITAFSLGLLARPQSVFIFEYMLAVSILSYTLGKTRYPRIGTFIFSFGFLSTSFLSLFLGIAPNFSTIIYTIVPIALIVASALSGLRTFALLVIYATIAASLAPIYSKTPASTSDITQTGGIIFFTGAILYGILVFRTNLENSRLAEIRTTNQELQEIKTSLEKRVEERTHELIAASQQIQSRAMRLQIISEVSQEVSANLDQKPKELLTLITNSISEKLGYYHVGIFLLDENREYAVLRAANSQGGQKMLERRHQLKVGGAGIVGYVSQSGRPRIVLDTGSDAVFFNNPNLPKTRSEIALPLKYGKTVIGVLDVQSTLSSAFKDEDANLLSTLANQIAIVINNVLSNQRSEFALPTQKSNKVYDRLNQKQNQSGYSYLPDGTISIAQTQNNATLEKALASGETSILSRPSKGNPATLAVPVKFRDQTIGVIHIQAADDKRRWTEDEVMMVQSISDRAALALENARLFEETVRRADQEESIARVTSQISASTDFKRILQTTVQELGQALGTSRSFIQLGTPLENENNDEIN